MKKTAALSVILCSSLVVASCSSAFHETPHPTLAAFSGLPRDITFPDLVRKVGESHDDTGSGIHIYRYHLPDGTTVLVGTDRQRIFYVTHLSGAARTRLFPNSKHPQRL